MCFNITYQCIFINFIFNASSWPISDQDMSYLSSGLNFLPGNFIPSLASFLPSFISSVQQSVRPSIINSHHLKYSQSGLGYGQLDKENTASSEELAYPMSSSSELTTTCMSGGHGSWNQVLLDELPITVNLEDECFLTFQKTSLNISFVLHKWNLDFIFRLLFCGSFYCKNKKYIYHNINIFISDVKFTDILFQKENLLFESFLKKHAPPPSLWLGIYLQYYSSCLSV